MAGRTIDLRQPSDVLDVNVVNQLDLSTIESLLTSIKDSAIAIDANTDTIEAKLDSVISELQSNGTTNHADLLLILTELQSIDANTDTLETQLASIISNTSTNATEATLLAIKAKTDQMQFSAGKLRTTGEDGSGGGGGSSINEKLLQVDSEGTTTYIGYADAGTLTSAATWAIKRIIETGNDISITWADGNNSFDNIWDNRLTLTYS